MATIIRTNGKKEDVRPKNGTDFTIEELREIVGGYIEIVRLPDNRIMVVNEEGKLYNLPKNVQATHIYGYEVIVGDVLVCDASQVK